jgi:hypothetical protein
MSSLEFFAMFSIQQIDGRLQILSSGIAYWSNPDIATHSTTIKKSSVQLIVVRRTKL